MYYKMESSIWQVEINETLKVTIYTGKVASFNTSWLEAHAGLFRLLMKGIFDPYVL